MVKLNRKLRGDRWEGEQGKSPTAEFYMVRGVGGGRGCEWFYECECLIPRHRAPCILNG